MAAVPPKPSAADVLKKLQTAIGKVGNMQKAVSDAAQKVTSAPTSPGAPKRPPGSP
jgi:hypothetical protein